MVVAILLAFLTSSENNPANSDVNVTDSVIGGILTEESEPLTEKVKEAEIFI